MKTENLIEFGCDTSSFTFENQMTKFAGDFENRFGKSRWRYVFMIEKLTRENGNIIDIDCIVNLRDITEEKLKEAEKKYSKEINDYMNYKTVSDTLSFAVTENELKIWESELNAERQQKKYEKRSKLALIFLRAKETNEKQIISQHSEDCDESVEDCSIDNVITYAMPDGSEKTERIHCY